MKKILIFALVIVMAMTAFVGCGPKETPATTTQAASGETETSQPEAPRELVISTFGLSDDVVTRDVFAPFEEANNVKIIVEVGNASERYTKLESNPNSNVDVIELSQSTAAKGYEKGLFEKLDYSLIPNAEKLLDSTDKIVDKGFGPPYVINSVGIIYDKEAAGMEINDWSDLWDPQLKGKISIPDITTTFGPAMVHAASEVKGIDITTDNGQAAFEALAELEPNIVKTYTRSSDLANMFTSGEIVVAVVGDFAIPIIQSAAPQVEFVVPVSGTYANFNTIDINVNSPNKDLAYKYIEWRLSSELQSVTAKSLNEAPVNKEVELDEETAKNKTYGEIAENAKSIDYEFVNPLLTEWIDLWNRTLNN
jgi:putative spermidine/putrescine transport system substrate-binding protein